MAVAVVAGLHRRQKAPLPGLLRALVHQPRDLLNIILWATDRLRQPEDAALRRRPQPRREFHPDRRTPTGAAVRIPAEPAHQLAAVQFLLLRLLLHPRRAPRWAQAVQPQLAWEEQE